MTNKERYQAKKEGLRFMAQTYQATLDTRSQSWEEVARVSEYFQTFGKRYGLLKEFRENGII